MRATNRKRPKTRFNGHPRAAFKNFRRILLLSSVVSGIADLMRKWVWSFVVVSILTSSGFLVQRQFFFEPSSHGKRLSTWVLKTPLYAANKTNMDAVVALREIGTNAVPYLVALLNSKNSSLATRLWQASDRMPFIRWHLMSDFERCHRAMQALSILEHDACPALPELRKLLTDQNYTGGLTHPQEEAAAVLAHIRPEGVAILVQATTNKDQWVQKAAIQALGSNPPAEPGVVVSLTHCLKSENPDVRLLAAVAIGMLQEDPEIAVPALREALNDESTVVQQSVAHSLTKFGLVVDPSFDPARN